MHDHHFGKTLHRTHQVSSCGYNPPELDFVQAASFPIALWLSYHALEVARIQKGETVLVHRASSGVGQLAIQVAKHLGASVLAPTSSASKRDFLCRELDLSRSAVCISNEISLPNEIWEATNGNGIGVIVGSLDTQSDAVLTNCLAPFGRLVDVGSNQQAQLIAIPSSDTAFNTSRASINTAHLFRSKPALAHRIFQQALEMLSQARLKPPQPLHIFQANDVGGAFQHLQQTHIIGKRVIELRPGTKITVRILFIRLLLAYPHLA